MIKQPRQLLAPALSSLVLFLVLVALGTWQVHRLQWKQDILARIAAAEANPPVPLGAAPENYSKVSVTGRFRFDRVATLGAIVRDTKSGSELGADEVVALYRDGARPVLVDRGWVPSRGTPQLDEPAAEVTVSGYIRPAETHGWFSAPDDLASLAFYTADPAAIGAALAAGDPAPFILVEMKPATPGVYPIPAQTMPRPPNNHLMYVFTWYGLAVVLVVVFAVWARGRGQTTVPLARAAQRR